MDLSKRWSTLGLDYAREARAAQAKLSTCSLMDLDVCELASLIQTRVVTPVQAVDECFERIHDRNPRLNALVFLCEARAKAVAKSQADAIAKVAPHVLLPPLTGIPFVVKDLEDVEGLPTSYGSKVFAEVNIASEDSVQVGHFLYVGHYLHVSHYLHVGYYLHVGHLSASRPLLI